ncbi:MAG: dihydrofolate reductase [Gemmatimonadetes bacterium]|jgi:dihydrofolate reductase|nr:dihydrofolate reductase [Gemmatimonadota bacterium]MBT4610387.1 dihydrofolate reductase [Gemmatimonadota bacterium]MBT5056146.1 dihydrofolate reductase [Gemmatimonadota bacterium]MBT5142603.1 dihydrofolate reductase [Gemmatimonadota bacterium]MBT5592196.1 dihydrofolate reductase [Gemmatimonadota bacterium]
MKIALIAALNAQRVIGRAGDIPWHYKQDMLHFMRTTMGAPCIMGRLTYESFPRRPLPGRPNLVLSRQQDYALAEGAHRFDDLPTALQHCRELNAEFAFVCGGQGVYERALPLAHQMILTHVPDVVDDADTFFPTWDAAAWQIVDDREEDGLRYVTYERDVT